MALPVELVIVMKSVETELEKRYTLSVEGISITEYSPGNAFVVIVSAIPLFNEVYIALGYLDPFVQPPGAVIPDVVFSIRL